ncbi:xylose isomerase [Siphonobacter sp. BAB-5405]|uniref:hydroxypyruvate isomerase family protein n=1 Tax=Siphonobacter sp. BAB-5405 TaxID=1864825 RepID=UPI000C800E49|nr:TIM barrel protein [Siphonobacter sp. BAB-5405]PMD96250.1 xylose isomerase [Siphonobacter sp. BAB-5405]
MLRRTFVKNLSAAAGVAALGGLSRVTAAPPKNTFKLRYAPHLGMFDNLGGKDLYKQIEFMADQGFRALEDNGMTGRSAEEQTKMGDLLNKLGMEMGVFVLHKGGNGANTLAAGKKEHLDIFLKGCQNAIEVAKRCRTKYTTVVPGDFQRNLPIGIQTGNVIDALRRGAEMLEPHGLIMVLEPLSDTPDLYLRTSDQTYEICRAVNSPSCKILFDIYHMQKNEGHIIPHIDWAWNEIGYFQMGDNPGRNEPGSGEINYQNIFKHIYKKMKATNRDFIFGMEHGISVGGAEGEKKLIEAYKWADNFTV